MENIDIYRIDAQSMRVFLYVLETNSFSRAADIVGSTQSTVSHTIDRLRKTLKDPLFTRAGRGIAPTQAALEFAPRIRSILAGLESLASVQTYDVSKDQKRFVLGIPTPAVLQDVKMVQAILGHVAPNAKMELSRLAPRDYIIEMLTVEEADLAISIGGIEYPTTLSHMPYGYDKYAIFYDGARRGPVTSIEDYASAKHGNVNLGSRLKGVIQTALESWDIDRNVTLLSPTASMLGELIRGTDVIITAPMRMRNSAYKGLSYCPIPFDMPPIKYDLVWHKRFDHSGRNTWYRQLFMDCAAEIYP